ncbi:inovirus-type Gp2 protein, partial [Staphylococcus aureus]|nr:inovirus-type Gp2 protein [Staphylococcus aureus]
GSVKHQRQLRNFQRAASKNLRGALAYIDYLFERLTRLSVIRLDLSYLKTVAKSVTAIETRQHRRRLFKRVQSHPLFQHCVGYLWKLEYGLQKG